LSRDPGALLFRCCAEASTLATVLPVLSVFRPKRKRLISLISLISLIKKVNAFYAQLEMTVAGSLPGRGILRREAQGAPNGADERTHVVEATT